MNTTRSSASAWVGRSEVPTLSQNQWAVLAIPGAILVVMVILQIVSFGKFKDWLDEIKIGAPAAVAVVLIIAELWGALSLFKVPMNAMFRYVGLWLAVLVSGFWLVENLYLVSGWTAGQLSNSGYFGNYLTQSPGWWTAIEATIMLFWVIYAAELISRTKA
ncbi:MAG TPA: hypothetical protein VFW90_03495 [Candidatus Saccharimonadales bacterium]|nr:hypothetical protein [Candidatus Saccharimonadales bacterium]